MTGATLLKALTDAGYGVDKIHSLSPRLCLYGCYVTVDRVREITGYKRWKPDTRLSFQGDCSGLIYFYAPPRNTL